MITQLDLLVLLDKNQTKKIFLRLITELDLIGLPEENLT